MKHLITIAIFTISVMLSATAQTTMTTADRIAMQIGSLVLKVEQNNNTIETLQNQLSLAKSEIEKSKQDAAMIINLKARILELESKLKEFEK